MTDADKPMEDHVLVEVTVPAPADAVWAALRDPEKIKDWFGWDTDGLKDEIDFIFVTHAEADDARRVVTFVDGRIASDRANDHPATAAPDPAPQAAGSGAG